MRRVLAGRVAQMAPVALIVTVVIFGLTNLLPGDPTITILGEQASAEQRARARAAYGLDDPVPVRYAAWLFRAAQGDLGRSLRSGEPVVQMLRNRVPVTLELSALSILVAVAIGLPAGVLSARFRGGWIDIAASLASLCGMAIPYFWLGVLLILLFAVNLGALPPSGYVAFSVDPAANLRHLVLPALTIGLAFAALVMRQTRSAMLQVLSQDYIRTARAKGLWEGTVVLRHGLRNALIPVVTVIGLQVGALLGGAVVTETVFAMPGLGRMLVEGIFQRDFPAVQGAVLFIVAAVLAVNLATDLLYAVLDPRAGA